MAKPMIPFGYPLQHDQKQFEDLNTPSSYLGGLAIQLATGFFTSTSNTSSLISDAKRSLLRRVRIKSTFSSVTIILSPSKLIFQFSSADTLFSPARKLVCL